MSSNRKTKKLLKGSGKESTKKSKSKSVKADQPTSKKIATARPSGVQMHGKQWENEIISVVVSPSNLEEAFSQSHTAVHDIPRHLNKANPLVNVSIKATGTNRIEFGDAKRTIRNIEKEDSPIEAIVVSYSQTGNTKVPKKVMRIDLTRGREALLGSAPSSELHSRVETLDRLVKTGDPSYKTEAKELQKYMKAHGAALVVAPKIGNKEKGRSGRLQISLANIRKFSEENPHLVIADDNCKVYGQECLSVIESGKRTFNK
jgi:hypothetical protein